jgi:hypothetical protein
LPSFRLILDILAPRPGVDPPLVLPLAAETLGRLRRVEDRDVLLREGQPQLQLRFFIEPTNREDEEVEAILVAGQAAEQINAQVAAIGQWTVRRRDGRTRGGWPRVGGGSFL